MLTHVVKNGSTTLYSQTVARDQQLKGIRLRNMSIATARQARLGNKATARQARLGEKATARHVRLCQCPPLGQVQFCEGRALSCSRQSVHATTGRKCLCVRFPVLTRTHARKPRLTLGCFSGNPSQRADGACQRGEGCPGRGTRRAKRRGRPFGRGARQYDAFGQFVLPSHPSTLTFGFTWKGYFYDADVELYYLGYRFYSPRTGRFLTRDPIGEAGGLNLYAHVRGDAINHYDILGLSQDNDGRNRPSGIPWWRPIRINWFIDYVLGVQDDLPGAHREDVQPYEFPPKRPPSTGIEPRSPVVTGRNYEYGERPEDVAFRQHARLVGEATRGMQILLGRDGRDEDILLIRRAWEMAKEVRGPNGEVPLAVTALIEFEKNPNNVIRVHGWEQIALIRFNYRIESVGIPVPSEGAVIWIYPRHRSSLSSLASNQLFEAMATLAHEAIHYYRATIGQFSLNERIEETETTYLENIFRYYGNQTYPEAQYIQRTHYRDWPVQTYP